MMISPFPGMDPYLESQRFWSGVQARSIVEAISLLQPQLVPRYYAEVVERIYFDEWQSVGDSPHFSNRESCSVVERVQVAVEEPFRVGNTARHREVYLEIRPLATDEVVTVLEIISPANKRSGSVGWKEYHNQQEQLLSSATNLVEIDLLRSGALTINVKPGNLQSFSPFYYVVAVNRVTSRKEVELYPVTVRQRLPRFRIPLQDADPDVVLDLEPVFKAAYKGGGYWARLDYREEPTPPFRRDDEPWADTLLREAGFRD